MIEQEEKRNSIEYLYRNIKHLCKIDDYDVLNIIIETATEMYEEEIAKAYEKGYDDALNAVDSIINKVTKIKQNGIN